MSDTNGCKKTCWMIGAAAGLVVAAWLLLVAHLGFLGAVFLGLMTFGLFGGFLNWAFCGPDMAQGTGQGDKPAANDTVSSEAVSPAVAPEAPAVAVPAAVPASATPAAAAPAAAVMSSAAVAEPPVAEAKAEAPEPKAEAPKAEVKKAAPAKAKAAPAKAKEAEPAVAPATKAAPKPKAAKAVAAPAVEKTAPVKGAAKPAASKAAAAKAAAPKAAAKVAAKAEAAPVAADTAAGKKPKGLKAARRGKPDDLKLIEGIGAKLEERLNEWGVFHFDQIAAWGDQEVAYADNNVPRFKGRASRDKWVAQAKLIVSEGVDAFLERAKTNDY